MGVSLLLVVKLFPVAESAVSLRQTLNLPLCDFETARMTVYLLRHVRKLDSWRRHLGSRLSRGLGRRRSKRSSRCTCTWVSGKGVISCSLAHSLAHSLLVHSAPLHSILHSILHSTHSLLLSFAPSLRRFFAHSHSLVHAQAQLFRLET